MSWQEFFGLGDASAEPRDLHRQPKMSTTRAESTKASAQTVTVTSSSRSTGKGSQGQARVPEEKGRDEVTESSEEHERALSEEARRKEAKAQREQEEAKRREARALRRQRIRIVLNQGLESQDELRKSNPQLVASPREIEWVCSWRTRRIKQLTMSSSARSESFAPAPDFDKSLTFHGVPSKFRRQPSLSSSSACCNDSTASRVRSKSRRSHSTVDSDFEYDRSPSLPQRRERKYGSQEQYTPSPTIRGHRRTSSLSQCDSPASLSPRNTQWSTSHSNSPQLWQDLGRAHSMGCQQAVGSPHCSPTNFIKTKSYPPPSGAPHSPVSTQGILSPNHFSPSRSFHSGGWGMGQSSTEQLHSRDGGSPRWSKASLVQGVSSSGVQMHAQEESTAFGGDFSFGLERSGESTVSYRREDRVGSPDGSPHRVLSKSGAKSPLGAGPRSPLGLGKSESFHGLSASSTRADHRGVAGKGGRLLLSQSFAGAEEAPELGALVGRSPRSGMMSPGSPVVDGHGGERWGDGGGQRVMAHSPRLIPCPAPRSPKTQQGPRRAKNRKSSFSVDFDAQGFAATA